MTSKYTTDPAFVNFSSPKYEALMAKSEKELFRIKEAMDAGTLTTLEQLTELMDTQHDLGALLAEQRAAFHAEQQTDAPNELAFAAVFVHLKRYVVAVGTSPDVHHDGFETKGDALLGARRLQIELGRDPNFILDLTNVPKAELEGVFL